MATLSKSQFFLFNVFNKSCDVSNGTGEVIKIALLTTLPVAATAQHYGDVSSTEVANGNGYLTGGLAVPGFALTNTSGVVAYRSSGPPTFTPSGGNIGPFRYLLYYAVTSGVIIGWEDYGATITLSSSNGDTFTPDNTTHQLFSIS